jgi:hypothetical protein
MVGTQFTPHYFLLQKGGTFDDAELNSMLSGQALSRQVYEVTKEHGLEFNVITLPREEGEEITFEEVVEDEELTNSTFVPE